MDSSIIKTYLLELLFELMEQPKFRHLSHGSGEAGLLALRDGVATCLARVSGQLDEAHTADGKLYAEVYDRWGELAPRIVARAAKMALRTKDKNDWCEARAEMCYYV